MLKVKKGDRILVAILILLSIFLYIFIGSTVAKTGAEYISVQVDGVEIERIKLGELNETKELQIKTLYGDCILAYDSDSCWMEESECKDKLCIKQGKISKTGQIIVCLPFRVMVEIVGENSSDMDIINH